MKTVEEEMEWRMLGERKECFLKLGNNLGGMD